MSDAPHKTSSLISGIATKLLLALLVMSFAVWGIGDMITGSVNRTVVTIGNTDVGIETFQRAVQRESNALRRAMGNQLTPEMLASLQPEQRALQSLITQVLLQKETEALGIIPDDADLVRHIRNNPAFHDEQGNFNKEIFESVLDRSRLTEKIYLASLRQEMASELLMGTLVSAVPVSDKAIETMHKVRQEQRKITLYTLDESSLPAVEAPDSAALETYFSQHSGAFSAPEYRTLSYVVLKPEELKAKVSVSEDEIQAEYQSRIEEFRLPERRAVEQLLFTSEEEAKKAAERLANGEPFEKVAKDSPIMNKGATSLGKVERERIIDAAADAVFTAKAGESTQAIQSAFGWHVFHISAIEAPKVAPLSEVRAKLEADLEHIAQDRDFHTLANSLEDSIAAGATLPEAAAEFSLTVHKLGPITAEGNSPDGSSVKLPDLDRFLETAFATPEKMESHLIGSSNGSYYIVRADNITPERQRTLDEVRALVTSAWLKDEKAKRLGDMAIEVAKQMANEETRAAALRQYKLKNAYSGTIKRGTDKVNGTPLPGALIADIFAQPKDGSTSAYPVAAGKYAIAVAGERIPAKEMTKAESEAIMNDLGPSVTRELVGDYIAHLERKYPVHINEELVQAIARDASSQ